MQYFESLFAKQSSDLLSSIEECLQKRRIVPCLILLYSGIDIMASLTAEPGKCSRSCFKAWVQKYILDGSSFTFSAVDLYAARCGVVHTQSPDSQLFNQGDAFRIGYSWGDQDPAKLVEGSKKLGRKDDERFVHLDSLVASFREGIVKFLDELDTNAQSRSIAERAMSTWFSDLAPEILDQFLAGR